MDPPPTARTGIFSGETRMRSTALMIIESISSLIPLNNSLRTALQGQHHQSLRCPILLPHQLS